jgi:DNA ligase-1
MNPALLNKVEAEPKRNLKEKLLATADPATKEAIRLALDTFITFGITVPNNAYGAVEDSELSATDVTLYGDRAPLELRAMPASSSNIWWPAGRQLLISLANRAYTGSKAASHVRSWLLTAPTPDHAKWGARVINKDLRMGVSVQTVLKVWPGLIEPFTVALAQPLKDQEIEGDGYLEPKFDGVRMTIVDGVAYSRNGRALSSVQHIIDALGPLAHDWVWDGEALEPGVSFEETNGKIRRGEPAPSVVFYPFDVIDRSDWRDRDTPALRQRKADLHALTSEGSIAQHGVIKPVFGALVRSPTMSELLAFRDAQMAAGYEGGMWKPADRPYEFRRSDAIVKLKKFETIDARIIDTIEGNGKHAGRLGALTVEIPPDISFEVGSGFTDAERTQLWGVRAMLPGRIVEVRYQNRTAHASARFPTFVRMRPDKETL